MMHNLGATRSRSARTHLLQTPDTFIRTVLPGMSQVSAIVHAAPALGAGFLQYTAEFEVSGTLGPTPAQRLLYVLDGGLDVLLDGTKHALISGGYAFMPQGMRHTVSAKHKARAVVIEKSHLPHSMGSPSIPIIGHEKDVAASALMGDNDLQVQTLLPDKPEFDFAVNLMTYQPGASLSMVEIHVMEHGLLMLEGSGIYRLGDDWHPVTQGDFIWMAPYCPQWFGALGKTPARYIIYKDSNRHPLGEV